MALPRHPRCKVGRVCSGGSLNHKSTLVTGSREDDRHTCNSCGSDFISGRFYTQKMYFTLLVQVDVEIANLWASTPRAGVRAPDRGAGAGAAAQGGVRSSGLGAGGPAAWWRRMLKPLEQLEQLFTCRVRPLYWNLARTRVLAQPARRIRRGLFFTCLRETAGDRGAPTWECET